MNLAIQNKSIQKFIDKAFYPLQNQIESDYRTSKQIVLNETNHTFKLYKPTLVNENSLSEKHRYLSKFTTLSSSKTSSHPNRINTKKYVESFGKYKPSEPKDIISIKSINTISWKHAVYKAIKQLKRLKIKSIKQIFDDIKFSIEPTYPYQQSNSFIAFEFAKNRDHLNYMSLINKNRLISLDYDYGLQTQMHWLAKRNSYDLISFAIHKGANPNRKDFAGQTPLHIACREANFESIMVLLFEQANPFSKDNKDNYCDETIDVNNYYEKERNNKIKKMIKRARMLWIFHSMGKVKNFEKSIKRGLYFLFVHEMKLYFEFKKFGIYDEEEKYKMNFIDYEINTLNYKYIEDKD